MRHKIGNSALFLITAVLAILLTVFVNGIFLILSNRYNLQLDLTSSAVYQLDEDSMALLHSLKEDVSIKVLAKEDSFEGNPYLIQARSILYQYERQSPRVHLEFIDYIKNPGFAAGYPELSLAPGNILISSGDNLRQLTLNELFNYAPSPGSASGTAVVSSRAQEAISSALLQVASGRVMQAALLTGADTAQAPALHSLLRDNNYQVSQVNLTTGTLDAFDLCILLSPMVDLSLQTLEKLDAFLYNGGAYQRTLIITQDASQPHLPNLAAYLKEWGVSPIDGAVFETSASRTFSMQPFYPLSQYTDETMRDKLRDSQVPLLLPRARPFTLLFSSRDFQHTKELLRFSDTSGVRPSQAGSDFDPAKAELKGPLPALALLTRQSKDRQARSSIILSSSTAMLEAKLLQNPQLANAEYLLKLLDEQAGREQVMHIRPVSLASAHLGVNSSTARWLGILLIAVLPGLLLLMGVGIFLYRRHQ
ncbi:MAG: hypothetical protein GXZ04_02860 [Clostridiales bacterium]|nr:hypothetical protein [Clostridiales bacterium]